MSKDRNEYRETTNRYVYNRLRKSYLERTAKIRCSYCGYHRGENSTTKYYYVDENESKLPSWKLATKNRKQWMVKAYKTRRPYRPYRGLEYAEIVI